MSLECFYRSPDAKLPVKLAINLLAREKTDRSRGLRRPASVSAEIGDETRIISRASVFTSLNAELKIRGDPEWESETRRTHGDRDRERRGGEEEPHPLSSSSHGCSATRKHRADISERSRDVNDLGARVCVRARRANTHDACLRAKRTRRVSGAGDRAHRALFVTTTSRKNRGRPTSSFCRRALHAPRLLRGGKNRRSPFPTIPRRRRRDRMERIGDQPPLN